MSSSMVHRNGSIIEILQARARRTPHQAVYGMLDVDFRVTDITYAQLLTRVTSFAAWLAEDLEAGRRCLLIFPQGLDFIVAFLACNYIGAIPIPVNIPGRGRRLDKWENIVADAQVSAVISDQNSVESIENTFRQSPVLAALPLYCEQMAAGDDLSPRLHEIAFLQYTSGSTGQPKGVIVTHRSLVHNLTQIEKKCLFDPTSIMVSWLPFYHDMGLILGILQGIYSGHRVILMNPVDFMQQPLSWLKAIAVYGATHTAAPNFAYQLLINKLANVDDQQIGSLSLHTLKRAVCGAEPVHIQTMHGFYQTVKRLGLKEHVLTPGYGLAEATLVVAGYMIGQKVGWLKLNRRHLQSGRVSVVDSGCLEDDLQLPNDTTAQTLYLVGNGFVIDGHVLSIRDPADGQELEAREVGEICFTGPSVSNGYWNSREKSQSLFFCDRSGRKHLRTGDLGFIDDHGELYVTGRMKELIIIRGMNYYPQDIERCATQADDGLRMDGAAAFCIAAIGGEQLVLIQELTRKALRRPQSCQWAQRIRQAILNVHGIMPETIVFVPPMHIPRTTSGKLQRGKAKEMYLAGAWDKIAVCVERVPQTVCTEDDVIQTQETLSAYITALVAQQLAMAVGEIGEDESFLELGMNSLMLLSMHQELERAAGCPIPAAALFHHHTVQKLSSYVFSLANPGVAMQSKTSSAGSSLLEEIDQLSDKELFALLKKELGEAGNVQ